MPTWWKAIDSDPTTIGLKVSVIQEPANKTASDCLLSKGRLENDRTISFSRPTVHRPSTTPNGRCGSDWTSARHKSVFCRQYSYHKSRQKPRQNLTKKPDRVSHQLTKTSNKSCSIPTSNEIAVLDLIYTRLIDHDRSSSTCYPYQCLFAPLTQKTWDGNNIRLPLTTFRLHPKAATVIWLRNTNY